MAWYNARKKRNDRREQEALASLLEDFKPDEKSRQLIFNSSDPYLTAATMRAVDIMQAGSNTVPLRRRAA